MSTTKAGIICHWFSPNTGKLDSCCIGAATYDQDPDWLIEHGLTSPPTQYRLSGRRFYRSKDPTNSIKVLKEQKNTQITNKDQHQRNTSHIKAQIPQSKMCISRNQPCTLCCD